jgi:predicted metal-dependent hydrolase
MPTTARSRAPRGSASARHARPRALARAGGYFQAHEAFEQAWRLAAATERDFVQGLVHAVVFAYQTGRGRPVGAERQRHKAIRRLTPYAPAHRGLDVETLLEALVRAEPDLRQRLVERDAEPPVAVEEEQQAERDERHP